MITEALQDLLSLTRLCVVFQTTPRRIEAAAAKAKIVPAVRIDGLAYYDADQVERLRELLPATNWRTRGA